MQRCRREFHRCRLADTAVAVRTAVTKYAPAHALFLQLVQIVSGEGDARLVPSQLLQHSAGAVGQERGAVEVQGRGLLLVVRIRQNLLHANAVGGDHRHQVGSRVSLHAALPVGRTVHFQNRL